jgi:F0F1-type ATP synthase membrane subunit c/vacuolar-type H+-ATPase subunit K
MSGWFFKNSDLPDSKGKAMFNSDGKTSNPMGFGISIGVAIGCGVGVALGNLAIGIAIGTGIGVAFGSALRKQNNRKDEQSEKLD